MTFMLSLLAKSLHQFVLLVGMNSKHADLKKKRKTKKNQQQQKKEQQQQKTTNLYPK